MSKFKQYLGDGVYASHDGYQIWLSLDGQDPGIRIALEPAVLDALNRYAEWVVDQFRAEREASDA